jgi:hypothetical protein
VRQAFRESARRDRSEHQPPDPSRDNGVCARPEQWTTGQGQNRVEGFGLRLTIQAHRTCLDHQEINAPFASKAKFGKSRFLLIWENVALKASIPF